MPAVRFDTYYRYQELTDILHRWAEEHPNVVQVESIGKSYEDRDIWLVTVTNQETGPDREKPAFWIDGNIHATEVSGSAAALYCIHRLLTGYGEEEQITSLVDTRAFYVAPRLNPDGAELALADKPKFIRSSVRPYPREDEEDGLYREDIDGDGRMLQMRIKDPNGNWKTAAEDARLMVRRKPDEYGGTYYRLLPEGLIRNYDGFIIKAAPPREGLDLNRNFPHDWQQETEQPGAGPYPTSEPEVRAAVQFVADHLNITGGITFHTWSGVLLRPYGQQSDEAFPTVDLRLYKLIGERGTEITGYPNISVYHDFRYDPKKFIRGVFDDWMYDHLGAFAWTTELWSPQRQAGIEDKYDFIEWYRDHPIEHDLKLLRWSDEKLAGKGYVDWYEFDHPQLGRVELGGWDLMYAWRNPPPPFLEAEIKPHAEFAVFQAMLSPLLEVLSSEVKSLGDDNYRVRLVLINTGFLPTHGAQKALEKKVVRPIEVELELPEGAELVVGERKTELGQLEGRAAENGGFWPLDETKDRVKADWVVHAPSGGTVKLTARHQRAGATRCQVKLK